MSGFRQRFFAGWHPWAFTGTAVLAAALAVWVVPTASAHNSLVTVSIACTGNATYSATAWAGPTTASRTNTDVRIFSSTDGGSTWRQVGQGQFNRGDSFSFAGQFSTSSTAKVELKVQEVANWGDGVKPGKPGFATASRPSNCTPTTTTTTTTTTPAPPPPPTTITVTPPPATPPPPPVVTPPAPAPVGAITIVKSERTGSTGVYRRGPIDTASGQTLEYRMLVTNVGTESLTVKLVDPHCDPSTLVAAGSTTLAPGASVTFTCSRKVHAEDTSPFVNTATATAVTASGSSVGPVSSTVVAKTRNRVAGISKITTAAVHKVTVKAKPAKPVVKAAAFTG